FKDPYHVGIYIGGGEFIHASSGTNMKVVISSLDSGRYPTRYYGARRILK
ncbi:MAG TPA: hydrolase Nlp/P60, partial [Clostridiales bacterium]|nr:hydrolase Nlp/P60 [Clostridiales bacterium]